MTSGEEIENAFLCLWRRKRKCISLSFDNKAGMASLRRLLSNSDKRTDRRVSSPYPISLLN